MTIQNPESIVPPENVEDEHVTHTAAYVKLGMEALIGTSLTFTIIYMLIAGRPIPDMLTGTWGLIVGYFFGINGAAKVFNALGARIKGR